MNWLFHFSAAALLLATIAFDILVVASAPATLDAEARLIHVVEAAGLRYDGKKRIFDYEEYAFIPPNCATSLKVRLFPSIHRDRERARAWTQEEGRGAFLIYRGALASGDAGALTLAWLKAKAAILIRLDHKSAWDANLLGVAAPIDCAKPKIDWAKLLQTSVN